MGLLALLLGLAVIALAIIYSAFAWGTVFYLFWGWFILPVFPELPEITFYMAVGLTMFVLLLKPHTINDIKDEYRDKSKNYIAFLTPWIVLLMGWVITWII